MSAPDLRESVADVPAGLMFCRADGEAFALRRVSPRALWLLSARPIPLPARLSLHILRPKNGKYKCISLKNFQLGSARRRDGAVLTRFCFEDPEAAAAIRSALNAYARCVELRGSWGPDAYGQFLTAYPAELAESFPASAEQQRSAWFAALAPLPKPPGELAIALNAPELWQMYLETPAAKLVDAYARMRALPPNLLSGHNLNRLYLGNPYCNLLFPRQRPLMDIAQKARREGLKLTLVTAGLRREDGSGMDALLRFAQDWDCEVEANDFGTLERATRLSRPIGILLGPQINRRRKDPRMQWKAGMSAQAQLLAECAANDPTWRKWLEQFGVIRYEFERCGYDFAPPPAPSSLHFPFYQTNTAMWCPLRGLCESGSRGSPPTGGSCSGWCSRNVLLYPDFLHLIGRWNSLLALDNRPWNPEFMNCFDRWVLNF